MDNKPNIRKEHKIKKGDIVFIGRKDRGWNVMGEMNYMLGTWQKVHNVIDTTTRVINSTTRIVVLRRQAEYDGTQLKWIVQRKCITHIQLKKNSHCETCMPENSICTNCPYNIRNSTNNIDTSPEEECCE